MSFGFQRRACSNAASTFRPAASGNHRKALGVGFDHAQRAATDRTVEPRMAIRLMRKKIGWGAARGVAYCNTRQAA